MKVVRKITPEDFPLVSPTQYSQSVETGDQLSALRKIVLCNVDCQMLVQRIVQAVRL